MNILTRDALNTLSANLTNNKEYYLRSQCWLDEYFLGKTFEIETSLYIENINLITSSDPQDDLENVKIFYNAYKELSLEEASDARLWTYFSHKPYYDYANKRWAADGKITERKIRERFFYSQKGTGKLRNALARLWWYGKATYDSSYDNPYTLTEILLSTQDIAQNIFERNFSRNIGLTKNILKVMHKIKQEKGRIPKRDEVREFTKSLTRIGAFSVTDLLTENQIEEIILSCMN